jgi:transglutaminase-like putative cysteine protease
MEKLVTNISKSVIILISLMLIATTAVADTDDAAVILDKEVTCKIKGNKEIETEHYQKIEILNRDGVFYAIKIIEESSLLELKEFSGKLYDSEGNLVEEVERDDGKTICGYGSYEVYADYCYTVFGFSRDIYPFTVEYRYKLKQKTLFQWQDWRPQSYIPVRHAKYTLITDDDFVFKYKSSELTPPPEITESGGDKIYTWEMNDVPELEEGDYAGIIEFGGIAIQFAPPEYRLGKYKFDGSSWNSLSQGSYIMIHECLDISDEQKDIMDRIVAESESELEICRKLHRKISALSRYVAIHVDIGGWQPHKSKDTFERGYGDCKDLSTLYVSMLRYAGLDAKYVLLSTRNAGITDPDFPSLARFNHAILFAVADGDTIWIDPTRNDCDIGELPWVDENTYALVIDPTMGCLVRTDSSKAEQNLISRKVELWPQENRSVIISMEYRLTGNPRDHFNAFISSYSETSRHDILRNHMYRLSDKFLLDSLDFPKGGIDQPVQELRLWGKVRSALHKIGQDQIMDLTFLDYESNKKTYIDPETYKQPLELLFPKRFGDTVIIHLSDSKTAIDLPDSADIKDEIGAYRICCQAEDSLVVITREVSNYQYRIMPDGFFDYWAHRDAVKELGECFIKLGDK